jgi:peptide/nickel transport system permease protein
VLYVLKRILQAALTLLLASALSFFVIQLAPGNFLDQYRQSPQFSPETWHSLRLSLASTSPCGGST